MATLSAGSATCASTLHPETRQHCSMGEGVPSSPRRQQSEVKFRGWWILCLSMLAGVGSRLREIGSCFSPAAVVPGSREVQAQTTHWAASWHAWQRLQPLASTASAAGGSSARLRRVCRETHPQKRAQEGRHTSEPAGDRGSPREGTCRSRVGRPGLRGVSRNCVGTAGHPLETALETVVKHIETVHTDLSF